MNTIEINNISKKFKNKVAIDGLSFNVKEGELFALLGVNGAGKSTLINILSCLIEPSSGDAKLNNYSILNKSNEIKKIINVSPQETSVAPNLSVKENLLFIAQLYGDCKKQAIAKVETMIASFNLKEVENKKTKFLSGGYARRLSIAMALITDPKIIFLDEPTLGLDVIARRKLWETIKELKGKITIILTTHYMEEAETLADRIGIMANGRLKTIGTANEIISLTNAKNFEDAFVYLASEVE